jgi:outer membrane lipoprotein carrier protein
MINRLFIVALLLWQGTYAALAETAGSAPAEALITRLQQIDYLQGDFEQRQFGADNKVIAESSGSFRLLRPGYFAWDISSPDSQLILADPEFIWHFDRDLETVTRRPVAGNVEKSPLQVLGGDVSVLREQYTVEQDGDDAFTLSPLSGEPGFRQLKVMLRDGRIAGMEIHDRLDQRIEIMLSNLDSKSVITAADFAFTPPPDADLFYYDE